MKVRIIRAGNGEEVNALIRKGEITEMPSMHENWRFDFIKELKRLRNATGYILITEETSEIIEGCMIFQLLDKKEPYLAMIEVAPRNKSNTRKYDHVAGCLIAYAFKLSVIYGIGEFKAMLQLDILEEKKEDEIKLMAVYSTKYNAKKWGETTMVIMDNDGEALINKYLS